MKNFLVIDTANLYHRCLHSGGNSDIFTRAGLSIHIMMRSIANLVYLHKIDHVIFALEHRSWRKEVYPEYKANREVKAMLKSPQEIEDAEYATEVIDTFIEFLQTSTNCTVLQKERIEGDDWFGRIATTLGKDNKIYIVSGDTDFYSLITENVIVYDGMNDRYLTINGIHDGNGNKYEFTIKSNSKLSVGKINNKFVPEPKWWERATFVKIIRGDAGDNIQSAYPRVRMTKIDKAWDDMPTSGFEYTNFMNLEVENFLGKTTVMESFRFNKMLIDLREQPDEIIAIMDEELADQYKKPLVQGVGFKVNKFFAKMDLKKLQEEADRHVVYLSKPFPFK